MKIKMTKVFWQGMRLKDVCVGASKWDMFKYRSMIYIRRLCILAFLCGLAYGSFKAGSIASPVTNTVYAEKTVEVPVETDIPILEKIMKCESKGGHQFDANGQVLLNPNHDSHNSVDIGYAQINLYYHGKQAHDLGYDLTKEADNKAYARYLFLHEGSDPWSASRACWSK